MNAQELRNKAQWEAAGVTMYGFSWQEMLAGPGAVRTNLEELV